MKKIQLTLALFFSLMIFLLASCAGGGGLKVAGDSESSVDAVSMKDSKSSSKARKTSKEEDAPSSTESSDLSAAEEESPIDIVENGTNQSGTLTAGEWNDLENWDFWSKLMIGNEWKNMQTTWGFSLTQHIPVVLTDNLGKPVNDIKVELQNSAGDAVWAAKTDIFGKAELFSSVFGETQDQFKLVITMPNGEKIVKSKFTTNKENLYKVGQNSEISNKLDIMFVVDATGSMGDEMSFLQTELKDISARISTDAPGLETRTGLVFYRDKGDEYLTRDFDFTSDISSVMANISNQGPGGGGDFPEAVEAGLEVALNGKSWSSDAKARLLFLILDAPPHSDPATLKRIQKSMKQAAEMGVKIIPVVASGIDKPTEFLMRFSAITTNSTYVFLTDDSGVGNSHLVPTVGKYEVEFLNDLMVRLVMKYTGNSGS